MNRNNFILFFCLSLKVLKVNDSEFVMVHLGYLTRGIPLDFRSAWGGGFNIGKQQI